MRFAQPLPRLPMPLPPPLTRNERWAAEDFLAVEGICARKGQSAERDGDYFGPTVNRVARVLAIGYGGQVLLSVHASSSYRT
jgi:hypothetical protein